MAPGLRGVEPRVAALVERHARRAVEHDRRRELPLGHRARPRAAEDRTRQRDCEQAHDRAAHDELYHRFRRQVAVKAKYRLSVTAAEHDAMAGVLETCPSENGPDM